MVVLCYNSRLHCGNALGICDYAFVRDIRRAETFLQRPSGLIIPKHSERFHFSAERRYVCGHVPRAAQAFALLHEINNRNSRFRREPRSRAPQVAVQHQVTEHADTFPAQARNQSLQPGNGIGNVGRHGISLVIPRRSSLLPAASRECHRAPDRRGGRSRTSNRIRRSAVPRASCKWDKPECREHISEWPWSSPPKKLKPSTRE